MSSDWSSIRHGGIERAFPAGPLLRRIQDVCSNELDIEAVVPVTTARVAIANYAAILHDFPEVRGPTFREKYRSSYCGNCVRQNRVCESAINVWLIENAAFLSTQQVLPNDVNSAVKHRLPVDRAFRPPHYGRALVLPVQPTGKQTGAHFLDVKGAGVGPGRLPVQDVHGNGLEYLGVALADFFYGWLLDRVFARVAPGYSTVPVYAVLDLGFKIVDGAYGTAPAGLHVRRAHSRRGYGLIPPAAGEDEEQIGLHMELVLRTFGITSGTVAYSTGFRIESGNAIQSRGSKDIPIINAQEKARFDRWHSVVGNKRASFVNYQFAGRPNWAERRAQIVDLGHINVRRRFKDPLATRVRDALLQIGCLLMPGDSGYVQPDRRFALDHEIFGRRTVTALALHYANDFATGRTSSREIAFALSNAIRRSGF